MPILTNHPFRIQAVNNSIIDFFPRVKDAYQERTEQNSTHQGRGWPGSKELGHSRQKLNIYEEFCPDLCINIICIFSLPFCVKMHIVHGLSTRA